MIADNNAIIFSIFGAAVPAPILLYHKNRPFGEFLRLNFLIVSGRPIGGAYGGAPILYHKQMLFVNRGFPLENIFSGWLFCCIINP